MKLKLIKYISLIAILLSIFNVSMLFIIRNKKVNNNNKIINNLINKNNSYNYIDNGIVGYLEIDRLEIKNVIKKGVDSNILDQNVIGMLEENDFGNNNDIFLAGHNIEEVFKKLHLIKINDKIKITTKDRCYFYKVTKIITVNDNEIDYLKNHHKNKLTMVTCTNKSYQRLMVICDLINN